MPEELIQLKRKILVLENTLQALVRSDRFEMQRDLKLLDGRNIKTGITKGLKIGTAISQKIGFFNVTPVDQPATVSDPTIVSISGSGADANINANFSALETAVETIIDRLQELGIIA